METQNTVHFKTSWGNLSVHSGRSKSHPQIDFLATAKSQPSNTKILNSQIPGFQLGQTRNKMEWVLLHHGNVQKREENKEPKITACSFVECATY